MGAILLMEDLLLHLLLHTLLARQQPSFFPTIMADLCAQGKHGIDMRALPLHASAFESCLHHRFIGTFHTAAAKRPTQLLIARVLHGIAPNMGGRRREMWYAKTRRVRWVKHNRPTRKNLSSKLFNSLKPVEKVKHK